ncbi:hypothetical protein TCSYLVIO_000918 [Trypanosoma cruzi]|nr:hypothetical protein TCSYLVIO_000918 [Trypanosoma cruzi]
MDQAFPPPPHRGRHGLLIPRRNTGNSAPSTAGMPSSLEIGTATVWDCPSPFATEYSPLLYGRPLRCSLFIVAAKNKSRNSKTNCSCDEYWLHFPWNNNPRGVRGSPFFIVSLPYVLLCALHLFLCVCVPSVRGAGTTDRSRRVCMRWSLVCRSCLLLPPPSVCVCMCTVFFFFAAFAFCFTFSAFCYCRFIYDARGVVLCLPLYWSHLLCAVCCCCFWASASCYCAVAVFAVAAVFLFALSRSCSSNLHC